MNGWHPIRLFWMNGFPWNSFFFSLSLSTIPSCLCNWKKKKKSHLVSRSRNSHPKARILMKKVWQLHKTHGALLRVEHKCFYVVIGTRKSGIRSWTKVGKREDILHFPAAAYGFLIRLCKGKPGREGPMTAAVHTPPIILLPPHLVPRDTLTS